MTEAAAGRRRLGRGLEALLGPTREEAEREGSLVELPVTAIRANPFQPRRDIDPAALEELKSSIRQVGLLQPVVVRPAPNGSPDYELIAGERRLRACQALGWEKIPAVQRAVDDRTLLTLALIENLQRDDLSPVDEARGYDRLIAEFHLTRWVVIALRSRTHYVSCVCPKPFSRCCTTASSPSDMRARYWRSTIPRPWRRWRATRRHRAGRCARSKIACAGAGRPSGGRECGAASVWRPRCGASRTCCAAVWAPTCASRCGPRVRVRSTSRSTPTTIWPAFSN